MFDRLTTGEINATRLTGSDSEWPEVRGTKAPIYAFRHPFCRIATVEYGVSRYRTRLRGQRAAQRRGVQCKLR